jgi:hypothetical protein
MTPDVGAITFTVFDELRRPSVSSRLRMSPPGWGVIPSSGTGIPTPGLAPLDGPWGRRVIDFEGFFAEEAGPVPRLFGLLPEDER